MKHKEYGVGCRPIRLIARKVFLDLDDKSGRQLFPMLGGGEQSRSRQSIAGGELIDDGFGVYKPTFSIGEGP